MSNTWINIIINNSVFVDGNILENFKIAIAKVPIHLKIAINIDWPKVFPLFKIMLTNNIDIIKFCKFAINPDAWTILFLYKIEISLTNKIINIIENNIASIVNIFSSFLVIRFLHFKFSYPYFKNVYNIIKSRINHKMNIILAINKFSGGCIKLNVNSQAKLRANANKGIPQALSLKLL